jgi:subtilisin family serine protease
MTSATIALGQEHSGKRGTEIHDGHEVAANEILVKFRTIARDERLRLHSEHAIDADENVGGAGFVRLHSTAKSAGSLLQALRSRPDVEYAEPNYIVQASGVPNDTEFVKQYGLQNTGQVACQSGCLRAGVTGVPGADIGAVRAWDITTGSSNIVVAVLDTGVHELHPDLMPNLWTAPASFSVTLPMFGCFPEIACSLRFTGTFTCPAGSHGFNTLAVSQLNPNVCDAMDDNGHGTMVAGIIGAAGNNSQGVAGVNWTTTILPLKFLDSTGHGSTADAINAIEFAIQLKQQLGVNIRVINNSWGGSPNEYSQALLAEVNRANASNILMVAAAGNGINDNGIGVNLDVNPTFPASLPAANVIAVGATDLTDSFASISNFGTTVHLAAPGVDIHSTRCNILPTCTQTLFDTQLYGHGSGTSFAAPFVSGAAALILSACNLDTVGLKNALLNNVDVLPQLAGKVATSGRLNVYNSLVSCAPDFDFAMSPSSVTIAPGEQTGSDSGIASPLVTVTPRNGFAQLIRIQLSGLPSGVTATVPNFPAGQTGTSNLVLSVAPGTSPGSYPITVMGQGLICNPSGPFGCLPIGTAHSLSLTLMIQPAPEFYLNGPQNAVAVPGFTGLFPVSVNLLSGFNAPIAFQILSVTANLPPGSAVASGSTLTPGSLPAPGAGRVTISLLFPSTTPTHITGSVVLRAIGGGRTHTITIPFTILPPARQLLGNPGFEAGGVVWLPWMATPNVIDGTTRRPAHSGLWKAWLNGWGTTHQDILYQDLTIPADVSTAVLGFFLRIDTAETTRTAANDTLTLWIVDPSTNIIQQTLGTWSNLNATSAYTQQVFDVSAWKGKTIRLYLYGTENASLQTSFLIDDTSLMVQ